VDAGTARATVSPPGPPTAAPTSGGARRERLLVRLLFLAAVPLLFLQLPLRRVTEPYPAILFPAGATLLKSGGQYTAYETELLATDAAGQRRPFTTASVLGGVPSNYRIYVLERGFGLLEDRDVRRAAFSVGGKKIALELGRPLEPPEREATRVWLRRAVGRATGLDPVAVHIDTYAVTRYETAGGGGGPSSERPPERRLDSRKTVDLAGAGSGS
jgi:hypothetical protein